MSNPLSPAEITIGVGATMYVGSDCYPYTVHKIEGKKLWASRDTPGQNKKVWPEQEFDLSNHNQSRPDLWQLYTYRKDGCWHSGNSMTGQRLFVGNRRYYQDPSF